MMRGFFALWFTCSLVIFGLFTTRFSQEELDYLTSPLAKKECAHKVSAYEALCFSLLGPIGIGVLWRVNHVNTREENYRILTAVQELRQKQLKEK